nr:hypothetical transcript [Hymenolepis microstoma]
MVLSKALTVTTRSRVCPSRGWTIDLVVEVVVVVVSIAKARVRSVRIDNRLVPLTSSQQGLDLSLPMQVST